MILIFGMSEYIENIRFFFRVYMFFFFNIFDSWFWEIFVKIDIILIKFFVL